MVVLDYMSYAQLVAYSGGSLKGMHEFHEIFDFSYGAIPIHHALTVSLLFLSTFVEQFWMSAKSKIINNFRHITAKVVGDNETIAQVLLNMSQAKAVSREKEKGVELKDVEETERPRPTSTRSLLTLKPLPKIDPKDKGKKKIEEEDESDTESEGIPEAEKKFKQLARDEEMARKVQEDWEAEEEVKKLAEEEAIKTALSNEYDFIQARIKADRLLALRLQDEEREQFTVEERAKFLHDTIAAQRRFLAEQRAIAIKNKPPTRTQLRNQMMTYLKHVGNKKHSDLKNKTFEDIQAIYEKVKRFDESFTAVGSTEDERRIKEMNEGVKDPDQKSLKKRVAKETSKKEDTAKVPAKVDVTEQGTKKRKGGHIKMLARKRKRPQSDVNSDDEHRKCLKIVTFEGTMDSETRQDLFHLYDLVMEQYSEITLEGIELILWGDLKIMMESSQEENDQSDFWDDQQDWEIVTWRLYEACGVYILELKDGTVIHMLVERRYPLSKDLLQRMLNLGLEVERESTVALDLIIFIKQQIGLVQDQTVLGKDYSNLLIADSLLKTIWFINAPCYGNEALASPKANGIWRQNLFLIVLTQKATNLTIDERYDLNVALHMFARRIVIQRQVEDLQLGVESYQKKLNLTKPNTFRSNLRNRTTYTAYSDPKRVIYKDQNNKNKLMRADELHKFSDGTLNDVRIALYDIAKGIRMEYLPKRKWSRLDKRRARVMVQDISKHLYERRLMRNLEKFVGGREYGKDLRWLSLGIHSHDPARTGGIYPRDIPLDSVEVLRSWCSIEHQGSFLKGLDYRGFATRCRNIQGSWIFELSMLSTLGKESSRFVGFSVIKDRQRSPVSFWVLDGISSKNKEPGDLAAINTAISDEDQALLLFTSLPSYYNNFVETLLYGWDTLKLEDMLVTLNSRELQKMTEAKGDGGKGLYNHKKSQGFQKMTEAKGDGGRKQQTQVSDSGADGYDRADVNAVYGGRAKLDNAGAVEKRVLDQTFNRLQKLISQLEIHGESISQEDVNQKFLRSLSPEWNTHTIVWRNKPEIDTLSLDDLYNNLKIYEPEVKGTSSSSTNTQNVAFVSSNNTSCTNGIVNTALGATNASTQATAVNSTTIDNLRDAVICGFFASTEPIGLISLEVKFTTSTKRDTLQESAGLQETKKTRIGRTQEVDQAEEGPTNFALMAYSSTSSNSKVSTDSNCSSSCLENVKILKEQNEQLLKDLRTSKINAITYKIGNFVPLKPDLSFSCLEEFVNEPIVSKPTVKKPVTKTSKTKTSEAKTSKAKPRVVRKNNSALIIEDWVSNSEEEDRVNTVSGKNVNTARPKAVVNAARPKVVLNAVKGNQVNAVKALAF
ncbi:hypothetical protein Tco_0759266 [Tanacetum coccineum]